MGVSNGDWLVLCVTHSDRVTDLDRCSLNFFEKRYDRRLQNLPPFETLSPSTAYSRYKGVVTVWGLTAGSWPRPELLATLRPSFKPQHALWHNARLWLLGTEVLEVYDRDLTRQGAVTDPWLADAHTVAPGPRGSLLVSCSGSDAVLFVDPRSLRITRALRMPEELYGLNYPLTRSDSVVEHFIPNDLQTTHVNAASSWRDGVVVSTLAQGAIGWFTADGDYTEITKGFVGCHGVRADPRNGGLYFTDSTTGTIVFLDEDGRIRGRFATRSSWLHDAQHLDGDVFALAVTDRNVVEISNVRTKELLATINGGPFGEGPQFLSVSLGSGAWPDAQRDWARTVERLVADAARKHRDFADILPYTHHNSAYSDISWENTSTPWRMVAGGHVAATVSLRNSGGFTWRAGEPESASKITYRWLNANGSLHLESGELWWLADNVPPGGTVIDYRIKIQAPDRAGLYLLEYDIVQDGRPRGRSGSATLRVPVSVDRPETAEQPMTIVDLA
jgi:hypothetical protein